MGPDETGNVKAFVSLEVTCSHAVKWRKEFADVGKLQALCRMDKSIHLW